MKVSLSSSSSLTGFSKVAFNIRDGVRSSVVEGYLKPASSRRNLHILHGANVLKVPLACTSFSYFDLTSHTHTSETNVVRIEKVKMPAYL